ncbi:MAG: hypothetical protein MRZ29_09140 [Oscillospiraceae bacterium]|nr:hypothetical protein [Oscillospiraceae bacterium]
MLYSKKAEKNLSKELFENPTCEYRGAPFWAWNTTLKEDELLKQIDIFKEMGFGGFHMHSRVGLESIYLGEHFMNMIKKCVDKAKDNDMKAYLYDEDRWPSGTAGGYVTKEKKYRRKSAVFSKDMPCDILSKEEALEKGEPYFLAAYDIILDNEGYLLSYRRIGINDKAEGEKRYLYVHFAAECEWFNNQAAVDTMDKDAIKKFLDITFDAYTSKVGEEFGKTIPSIFTDEPCSSPSWSGFKRKFSNTFSLPCEKTDIDLLISWSTRFEEEFEKMCGYDILDRFPEMVFQNRKKSYKVRYDYFNCRSELFVSSFADQYKKRCDENNIAFTGHIMYEDFINMQTRFVAETMRFYRSFTIPGIDMLGVNLKFQTAKQAQSMKNQYGREGMLSELYGVTNWDFDFRNHKLHGDWQAALGVTLRVPHLAWLSMRGEGKRDYPASINYQSPWYKEYSLVENHFARLNTALTRGKPIVRVAVIHPVESFWVNCGPDTKTQLIRDCIDDDFLKIVNILLKNNIDFDFVCEAELPNLCKKAEKPLQVGEMAYDVVVLPNLYGIRGTTLKILQDFISCGGKVVNAGRMPEYVDGNFDENAEKMLCGCEKVTFDEAGIIPALESFREVKIDIFSVSDNGGVSAEKTSFDNFYIYNLRSDGNAKWLFIARGVKDDFDICFAKKLKITVNGEYKPTVYNTVNGEIFDIPYKIENGKTVCEHTLYASDSLLLKYEKTDVLRVDADEKHKEKLYSFNLTDAVDYTLCEPNIYLADRFDAYFDGELVAKNTEILKADNIIRAKAGYPKRGGSFAQPWSTEPDGKVFKVKLIHTFESEIEVENAYFATEEWGKIIFNGKVIDKNEKGYYVDRDIKKYSLGKIKKGINTIEINLEYTRRTNLESCYILGDFGVEVHGANAKIVNRANKIFFDTITNQTLPFYGGNLIYKTEIDIKNDCDLKIRAHKYRGALVKVKFDGKEAGNITFAPYSAYINDVKCGKHIVEFEFFGNRYNTFGSLHRTGENTETCGPSAYRAENDWWSDEFKLRNTGILKAPEISVYEK